MIVYNRNNARYTEASAIEVAKIPNVIGFKDGTGDLDQVARIVRAVTDAVDKDFLFFNGLPTAETTQQAYRAIGVPLYSSATFAFAPDLALAFYNALESGNDALVDALSRGVLPPAGAPARHRARLRRLARQGRRRDGRHPRRAGSPAADHAELRLTSRSCTSIIAAGRAVLSDALAQAR